MFDLTNEIRGFKNEGFENYRQMLLKQLSSKDPEVNFQHARQVYSFCNGHCSGCF
jgi:hypothetical protein